MKEEVHQKRHFRFRLFIFIALTVVALAIALYVTFSYSQDCQNYSCFKDAMSRCSKAKYLNDNIDATWHYTILGREGENCVVKVRLLQAKQGELGIDDLNGLSMECSYPEGLAEYPEKDMTKCHGILKEELQALIIKKLHNYLLQNLGQFNQTLQEPAIFS